MIKILSLRPCIGSIKRGFCTPPSAANSSPSPSPRDNMTPRYQPSELQKFILVWTKKFKSKEDVPKYVTVDLIERSRSEARIKISNILIALTALASFGAVLLGKAAAKRGESVHQMNLDWHKKYAEDYNKKQENATKD